MLTTELVRPIKWDPDTGEDVEWESVPWLNNTDELFPEPPGTDTKLGLVPYPHGKEPVVIADKYTFAGAWARSFFFFFEVYNLQTDVSDCVGKIYSVEEVGAEND
jgi:hypothetical protein